MNFTYIIEKINNAVFLDKPFKHLYIENLFTSDDFNQIINSPEINLMGNSDEDLFNKFFDMDYKIIPFPGCTTDYQEYITWHKKEKISHKSNTACEGFGVVLRLQSQKSEIIRKLNDFMKSPEFLDCIATKFGIERDDCKYDSGIQKYLDGYEISPHPDIRSKALTYMVNVNPCKESEKVKYHTSYLTFKPKWNYVKEFWKGNNDVERCWVPWDWCDIEKQQKENNSIVIFSPDNSSMHAVKAKYNHLAHQRTQLYGNLWYKNSLSYMPSWESYVVELKGDNSFRSNVKRILPTPLVSVLKKIKPKSKSNLGKKSVAKRDAGH